MHRQWLAQRRLATLAMGVATIGMLGSCVPSSGHTVIPARPRFLTVMFEGDSTVFTLTDPLGRRAVLAIDGTASAIPECDVVTNETMRMTVPGQLDGPGGGEMIVRSATPGDWFIEALVVRASRESSDVILALRSVQNDSTGFNGDDAVRLADGHSARWLVPLSPRSARSAGGWGMLAADSAGQR